MLFYTFSLLFYYASKFLTVYCNLYISYKYGDCIHANALSKKVDNIFDRHKKNQLFFLMDPLTVVLNQYFSAFPNITELEKNLDFYLIKTYDYDECKLQTKQEHMAVLSPVQDMVQI